MARIKEILLALDDRRLLALNAYFEARGEYRPYGDAALLGVMVVALNRAGHPAPRRWPKTVAGVLTQRAQFSWTLASDPQYLTAWKMAQAMRQSQVIKAGNVWERCLQLANLLLAGAVVNPVANATYYYNPQVCNPAWAKAMAETALIGHHRFMCDPKIDPAVIWRCKNPIDKSAGAALKS